MISTRMNNMSNNEIKYGTEVLGSTLIIDQNLNANWFENVNKISNILPEKKEMIEKNLKSVEQEIQFL